MRNNKAGFAVVFLLVAIIMMVGACSAAYATDEPTYFEPETQAQDVTDPPTDAPTDPPTQAQTDPPTDAPTEAVTQQESEQTNEQQSGDDKKDSLPKVNIGSVVVPEALNIPKAEISDTSLMGGVISWLCVAVGIAVLAGVLVSQRAKQVAKPRDSRRR